MTTQPIFKTVMNRVTFESAGETLVGNLYLPENVESKVAAFVIIGPMTFQKEQAPTEYAKRLAQKGYAALVFDPRYRGESSGEPRALEHPQAKVEDINSAVAFMAQQSGIDRERIFGLGICQGSSEMLRAVAENPAIKAGVTLAGHYRDREGDLAWLGEEGYKQRLTQGERAKEKYERTGEVDYVAAVDERDMNVGMPGKFVWDWYHVWAYKGLWDNCYAVMSIVNGDSHSPNTWFATKLSRLDRHNVLVVHKTLCLKSRLSRQKRVKCSDSYILPSYL